MFKENVGKMRYFFQIIISIPHYSRAKDCIIRDLRISENYNCGLCDGAGIKPHQF